MIRFRTHLASIPVLTFGILAAASSHAASLAKVTNWNGGKSFPSDVSMNIYVPDKVVTNPPVLTLIHYCGGSASAVFGQAATVIKVVDQMGVIVVVPDNGARCWDVQTTKGLTRDGGGDSHAIAQMVRYALTTYKANADRVYSTGDSSGGMMTQLLLALYPDIFKGGASFAGIPAGCRAGTETGNGYSGACAGGNITKTAQQWGDIVRAMDPGYSGHRPRVQLFHGDNDEYIDFKVFAEAIKEWANVLGLDPTAPTTTASVTLGTHQGTRQTWKNACGVVVLDAFQSIGGDHGPSDTLFNSFVPPFLGIDTAGAVDPEIAKCGAGGASGTGGASSAGGATSNGGTKSAGGAGPAAGGTTAVTGGTSAVQATGGATSNGGAEATGGRSAAGGNAPTGGSLAATTGGRTGVGGSVATGGNAMTGGNLATGGQLAKGGNVGTGGTVATSTGSVTLPGTGGGLPATGGASAVSDSGSSPSGSDGCSCTTAGTKTSPSGLLGLALGAMLVHLGRRKKR
ncbi:MAG TPA: PHB depolymerase family esterase [Polyangiaceae bacterium]